MPEPIPLIQRSNKDNSQGEQLPFSVQFEHRIVQEYIVWDDGEFANIIIVANDGYVGGEVHRA